MKVHYVVCATSFSVDGKTNQLSLFHVLDEISSPTFPLQIERLAIASLFEREAGDDPVQTYVLTMSLNGSLLASFTMRVDFQGSRRNRSVNTVERLAIPMPGSVLVSITQHSTVLARWMMPALQVGTGKPMPAEPTPANPKTVQSGAAKVGPTIN